MDKFSEVKGTFNLFESNQWTILRPKLIEFPKSEKMVERDVPLGLRRIGGLFLIPSADRKKKIRVKAVCRPPERAYVVGGFRVEDANTKISPPHVLTLFVDFHSSVEVGLDDNKFNNPIDNAADIKN